MRRTRGGSCRAKRTLHHQQAALCCTLASMDERKPLEVSSWSSSSVALRSQRPSSCSAVVRGGQRVAKSIAVVPGSRERTSALWPAAEEEDAVLQPARGGRHAQPGRPIAARVASGGSSSQEPLVRGPGAPAAIGRGAGPPGARSLQRQEAPSRS